jgi:diguanylate cyclase (GGDEF)-like protein
MMRPVWPTLSIRATVLGAIVLGVVLPAALVLVLDARLSRAAHEPLVQRNRAAVQTLATAVLIEPAWTLSKPGLDAAVRRILQEPSVCAVEVLDLQPGDARTRSVGGRNCPPEAAVVVTEAPVLHEGQQIARLRLAFDDSEIDNLLAARRRLLAWLVAAQAVAGVAILAGVLSLRLLRPVDRLKQQASSLVSREPTVALNWQRRDELGQLGQHLNEVRERIVDLIAELERKNAQLRKMAMYDHLTGLPNRTLFREMFQHEASAARRAQRAMALLFIDLDRFKAINDTLGHAAGDELLLGTSQRLLQALRQSDVVCRVSGDEFLVLLRDAQPPDAVAGTAERLLRAVEVPLPLSRAAMRAAAEPRQAQVTASIGVALYPRDGEDFETLVRHADLAMYQSKQQGRACVAFYRPELDDSLAGRLELERELAQAISRDELTLHFQPVVEASTGRICSVEALVRWRHPRRGLLTPEAFIGLAEESGLVREIGAWTMDQACAQLRAWRAAGVDGLRMAINVSALQFHDQPLVRTLQGALDRHRLVAADLELELTESALMTDSGASQRTVAELRQLGVALVVDDFGTGYSSLSYLKRLRPDKLKIDRSFVSGLPDDPDDSVLTQAILRMAQALEITVIAEGVETAEQRAFLVGHGCALLQGYLIGRPMPAGELQPLLGGA